MGWGETLTPSLSPYHPLLSLLTSFPLSPKRFTPDNSPHPHLPHPPSFTGPFRTRILYSIPPFSLFPSIPPSPSHKVYGGAGKGEVFFQNI